MTTVSIASTVGDVAKLLALKGNVHTLFSEFAAEGPGCYLVCGQIIFGYNLDEGGNHIAQVAKTEVKGLTAGNYVSMSELTYHASHGGEYFPSEELQRMHPVLATRLTEMFDALLLAIKAEGGHEKVLRLVNIAKRRHHEAKLAAERDQREQREKDNLAERIRADIKKGKLSSDPLDMFRNVKRLGQFGFEVDGKLLVFMRINKNQSVLGERNWIPCIQLEAAPYGVEGFSVGTHIPVVKIMMDGHPSPAVAAMAAVLVTLIGDNIEEAKRLSREQATAEGRIKEEPKIAADEAPTNGDDSATAPLSTVPLGAAAEAGNGAVILH
jgi:hypothetical protein